MRLPNHIEKRLRGLRVKLINSCILCVFLVLMVFALSCTRSVKEQPVPPPPPPSPPPKPRPEIRIKPDYGSIEFKIISIQRLDENAGTYNSYNPQFSSDGSFISVEVDLNNRKRIYIYRTNYNFEEKKLSFEKIKEVSLQSQTDEERKIEELFQAAYLESYNYEFTWFPSDELFIFTSNAGMGEYNLFLGSISGENDFFKKIISVLPLTRFGEYYMLTRQMSKDGQARVSPEGKRIVFTSGRTGNGDLYMINIETGKLKRLTFSEETDFFPRWSPDGKDIVYTTGGKFAHDIHVIRNAGTDEQKDEVLVKWLFDDVLPKYSPDGKYIAFYTTYNLERDPFNTKRWGIMVIPSDGSAPKAGKELVSYFKIPNVIKDNNQGVGWLPDSRRILYAKSIESGYNPIYIFDVETGEEVLVETKTRINHDIAVSSNGLVAFRAQVLGWDRIFIANTTYFQEYQRLLFEAKKKYETEKSM